MGLIELHLDKIIPTHRNTSRNDLKCLKKHGFYCSELSDHVTCQEKYDTSCSKLRTWKEDAIKRCEQSHSVNCELATHLKNYRPLFNEEHNRSVNVIGSNDSLLLNFNFPKDDKRKYKEMHKLISRFDGR